MAGDIERYIGGGTVELALWNGTDYEDFVDIGEVQTGTLKIANTYADGYSKDSGLKKLVDKVLIGTNATTSLTTQNLSKDNMAMAMFGTVETETFAIGEELPDGTTATVETELDVIKGGTVAKIEAKIRVIGVNLSGDKNPVLEIHHAFITPSGDVRDYFAEKHTTLGFDVEIVKLDTEDSHFKEYFIPKTEA